jgi:hypothetical protein
MTATATGCRLLGGLLLAAFLLLPAFPAGAQEPGQAGLVVQFDETRVETRCLEVPAEGAKGVDLLNASGLEVVADVSSGMGISVCQVEGQGCAYPAQHCFCQCMGGGECAYWNYFYREPGAETWTYSPLGAVLHTVLPGSVEAWVWGDGHTPPSVDLTFEAVCQPAAQATGTPTSQPTAAAPSSTPAPVADASPAVTPAPPTSTTAASATPATTAGLGAVNPSPPPDSTGAGGASGAAGYLAFAAMILLLAAVGVLLWLRRR